MAVSFETAWPDAEQFIFGQLVTATKHKADVTAFIDDELPPGLINIWRFNTGGGSALHTWSGGGGSSKPCFGSLTTLGELEGRYDSRAKAQLVAGRVWNVLNEQSNFHRKRHIQWFRMGENGMPIITKTTFTPARGPRDNVRVCHLVTMQFDLVFNTTKEY